MMRKIGSRKHSMEPESRLLMSMEMMVQFPVSPPEAPTAAMTVPFWIITTAMMGMVTGQKSGETRHYQYDKQGNQDSCRYKMSITWI